MIMKVANHTIVGQRKKSDKSTQGQSPQSNINKDVDISIVGENDMPF
jgi:hypothetical protein